MKSTLRLSKTEIGKAASLLREGALVAFPTETVYGVGADATNGEAVAAIFAAKNRPTFNPLIVHVSDLSAAEKLVSFTPEMRRLAVAFWPGPLSLVLPLQESSGLSELVTAGLPTVAIRVPAQPVAQQLLREVGRPIAAPSANPSGKISPTTADHVLDGLRGRIAAVLDDGPCSVGLESTILGGDPLQLLRPGGLPVEQAEALLGRPIAPVDIAEQNAPTAPGQLLSHYAPDTEVLLDVEVAGAAPHLGFGAGACTYSLSSTRNLTEAAANLFAMLRKMDAAAKDAQSGHFTVAPIPNEGLGRAIRDRLVRAAAPRNNG